MRKAAFILFISFLAADLITPLWAEAYVDPNIGGYLYQILFPIITAIMGVYFFFKEKLVSVLFRLFKREK